MREHTDDGQRRVSGLYVSTLDAKDGAALYAALHPLYAFLRKAL